MSAKDFGGFATDLAVGGMQMYSSHRTNEANKKIAREQMAFQERMSSTAYQRQVEDMKKAGINPMMAVNSGGASSPPGAGAQIQDSMGQGINAALKARAARAEVNKLEQEVGLTNALKQSAEKESEIKSHTAKALEYKLPEQKLKSDWYKENPQAAKISTWLGEALKSIKGWL